jgi:acetyl esterase/lipase
VPFYGVYDFTDRQGLDPRHGFVRFLERMVIKRFETDRDAFERASPMSRVHSDAPPFLVIHGALDSLGVQDARHFAALLRARSQAPVCYAELPHAQHASSVSLLRTRNIKAGRSLRRRLRGVARERTQPRRRVNASGFGPTRARSTLPDAVARPPRRRGVPAACEARRRGGAGSRLRGAGTRAAVIKDRARSPDRHLERLKRRREKRRRRALGGGRTALCEIVEPGASAACARGEEQVDYGGVWLNSY